MSQVEVRAISKYYRPPKERLSVLDSLPLINRFRNAPTTASEPGTQSGRAVKVQGTWALRNVSFDVAKGETLGIIGPNGAGKSTLLRILARVTMPTQGRVVGKGRLVSLLELGMGFQPELTARENIFLYGALYEVPPSVIHEQFDQIVQFAGIESAVDNPLRTYSSGMYLRLAFSVAVNLKPDVLLADEVLAVGDIAFQESCMERVQELRNAGVSTLFVSHDMAAIRRVCDRVLWLHHGEVRQLGQTDEVVAAYESYIYQGEASTGGAKRDQLAGNKYISLRGARLLSGSGDEIGALRIGSDAIIELRLETKIPGLDFYIGIDVFCFAGTRQHLLRLVQPKVSSPKPGVNVVKVRIPSDCFIDIPYIVNVAAVAVYKGLEHAAVAQSALGFRGYLLGDAGNGQGGGTDRAKGLIRPKVAWSVEMAAEERPT